MESLALKFPLSEAQEIIALDARYASWAELKTGLAVAPKRAKPVLSAPELKGAKPVIFVTNVQTTAAFFRDKLGFAIDFLHGDPPFYGSVSRGGACLHLRFVHEPVFKDGVRQEEQLLSAFLDVDNIKGLFAEFKVAGAGFVHPLTKFCAHAIDLQRIGLAWADLVLGCKSTKRVQTGEPNQALWFQRIPYKQPVAAARPSQA